MKTVVRSLVLVLALVILSVLAGLGAGPVAAADACPNSIFASVLESLKAKTSVPLRLPLVVADDYDAALYTEIGWASSARYVVKIGQNCERSYCPFGTVSGMNEKGLSVTINAAKTAIPKGSATPVSLVATEILQYASNIEQALKIAKSRHMFVSESFLIGSAEDKKAVIIEKTPDTIAVYDPQRDYILCANQFQSALVCHRKASFTAKKSLAGVPARAFPPSSNST